MIPSSVKRSVDAAGSDINTLRDAFGKETQAVGLVNEDGIQSGVPASPLHIQGTILTAIQDAIAALGTLAHVLQVQGSVTVSNLPQVSGTHDIAEIGALMYVGKLNTDGDYEIMRIDSSADTQIRFATIINNPGVADYAAAWAGRAALTYGTYAEAM